MDKKQRVHLSPHFILYELAHSATASELGLDNKPNIEQRKALISLCDNILEPLRQQFGPIVVRSGFRSPEVNKRVGGVPNSQHLRGEAADIAAGGPATLKRYYNFISQNLDFDQLILEPNDEAPRWVHVSYTTRHANRHNKVHL